MAEEKKTADEERFMIIDSDGGVDDAIALLVALKECRQTIRLLAVTSVFGNTTCTQASSNLLRIAAIHQLAEGQNIASDVPIFVGCSQPLMASTPPEAWDGHGPNGLGGSEAEENVKHLMGETQELHAVNALIGLVQEYPGKIDLVALGPLTNLAMACKLYPPFFQQLRSLSMMGGALHGRGNTNMVAEFNLWADPEAAKIVMEAAPAGGIPVLVVPWETTENAGTEWGNYDRLTTMGTVRSDFVKTISATMEKAVRGADKIDGAIVQDDTFLVCDVLPVVALLFPEAIKDAVEAFVDVETVGQHSRGMMAIDWYGYHHKGRPRVKLVRGISYDVLWNVIERVVRG